MPTSDDLDSTGRRGGALGPGAPTGPGPVFVIGSPRSGTSALTWALHEHPRLCGAEESGFFVHLAGCLESYWQSHLDEGRWLRRANVGLDELSGYVGLGIDRLYRSRTDGRRWVDSTPVNTLWMRRLAAMFPQARVVHLVRDGRAVVASMVRSGFDQPWAHDFRVACATWAQYVTAGAVFAAEHPELSLELRHETLAADPATASGRVLAFLGEEAHDGPRRFLETRRINSSYLESEDPAARPKPWTQWSGEERAAFAELAGETQRRLGYALD